MMATCSSLGTQPPTGEIGCINYRDALTWNFARTCDNTTLCQESWIPAPSSADDEQAFLDEVRDGGFTGRTIVASDLLRVPVRR
jgi:hypothetical protein